MLVINNNNSCNKTSLCFYPHMERHFNLSSLTEGVKTSESESVQIHNLSSPKGRLMWTSCRLPLKDYP